MKSMIEMIKELEGTPFHYRLELDDYSAASFISFSKYYFGALQDIDRWMLCIMTKKNMADSQSQLLNAWEAYQNGQKDVTISSAYREVPFLTPCRTLQCKKFKATDYSWKHLNTWQWPYYMKCKMVESYHYWFMCDGEFFRGVSARFYNLQYGTDNRTWKKIGGMIWGFPEVIQVDDGFIQNRLIEPEKTFKSLSEAQQDWMTFRGKPDPDYSEFLNDIFGDG